MASYAFGARRVREIVMCEPTHYRLAYEINPYMSRTTMVDPALAMAQWSELRRLVDEHIPVRTMPALPDQPDMVFVSDVGVCVEDVYLRSNFRHPERSGEVVAAERWFKELGYRVATIPPDAFFEGMGDFAYTADRAILGYGQRSSRLDVAVFDALPGGAREAVQVELTDSWFYHLGMVLAPLSTTCALVCRDGFTANGFRQISALFDDLVEVSERDAQNFAANAVCIEGTVVASQVPSAVRRDLHALGFEVVEVDVSEFTKAGGAVACMVLPVFCST